MSLDNIKLIVIWSYVLLAISAVVVIVRDRKDPVKTLAWILVVTLVPGFGLVLYLLTGRNRRKEKIFKDKEKTNIESIEKLCAKQLTEMSNSTIHHSRIVDEHRNIIRLLLNNNRSALTTHNRVEILNNGKATFAAMFKAMRQAQSSIHLEYYIFDNDRIGRKVINILKEKASEGVEVRLIVDGYGGRKLGHSAIRELRSAGVSVRLFMPVVFPWRGINHRNHRKIAVIDGRVGFTGGINIAERYLAGTKWGMWRDTHLQIEGDAASMLQAIFVADWYFLAPKKERILLSDEKYFAPEKTESYCPIQIASSGPDSDWAAIMQAFFSAITSAKRSIYISSPYFLPNQSILTALKVAALSGLDVRVLLPNKSDSKITYWASRSYIAELLEAGVKVFLYNKGFNHSKLIIIDEELCTVGSANMDIRSFEDNFEVAALIYDPAIAGRLAADFLHDTARSIEHSASSWDARTRLVAIYENVARLLSPLL